MARVTWRGATFDERTRDMLVEVASNIPFYLQPSQGSYSGGVSASAGTHNGGGAVDIIVSTLTADQRRVLVRELRRVGFAAWLRTPAQSNWPYHVHAIAMNCGDLSSGAQHQVNEYLAGRNGLAGRGADDGPRDFVKTTWEIYKKGKKDMGLTKEDKQWLVKLVDERVAAAVWNFPLNDPLGNNGKGEKVAAKGLVQRTRRMGGVILDAVRGKR